MRKEYVILVLGFVLFAMSIGCSNTHTLIIEAGDGTLDNKFIDYVSLSYNDTIIYRNLNWPFNSFVFDNIPSSKVQVCYFTRNQEKLLENYSFEKKRKIRKLFPVNEFYTKKQKSDTLSSIWFHKFPAILEIKINSNIAGIVWKEENFKFYKGRTKTFCKYVLTSYGVENEHFSITTDSLPEDIFSYLQDFESSGISTIDNPCCDDGLKVDSYAIIYFEDKYYDFRFCPINNEYFKNIIGMILNNASR